MPSSSARCAQLPRAVDKVPFFVALKKLRDHVCGTLPDLQESEVCFPNLELKCPLRAKNEPHLKEDAKVQILKESTKSPAKVHLHDITGNASGTNICNTVPHIDQETGVYSNGMENVSSRTVQHSSTPTLAIQGDVKTLSKSSGIPGFPGFPVQLRNANIGFQPLPIHHAFSTAASTMSGAMIIPRTATSILHSPSTPQVTSLHGSISVSNNQSHRQSKPSWNQEQIWTRLSVPAVTSSVSNTLADSTAHIPCTSSAVLTSEWINKHFNAPVQPQYNNDSWTTCTEHGFPGQSPWHMGNVPEQGYMKHELPRDGYCSVIPS